MEFIVFSTVQDVPVSWFLLLFKISRMR